MAIPLFGQRRASQALARSGILSYISNNHIRSVQNRGSIIARHLHACPKRATIGHISRPSWTCNVYGWHLTTRNSRRFSGIGTEPGVDFEANTTSYADHATEIKVIDFSSKHVTEQDVPHESLESFLRDQPRPNWAACRWITVNGLNSNVVQVLGQHKHLHRLSLEDVLDPNTPTKVDWYDDHCFMELTMQKLVPLHGHRQRAIDDQDNLFDNTGLGSRAKWRTLAHRRYAISMEQVSIFLTADTVITFFERSGTDVIKPILTRLQSQQTIIRSSNDPSMLVQAVIDVIVDMSVPVNKAVDELFGEVENAALSRPTIILSKHLYILRSALTLVMDNMIATGGLVRTLIDHRRVLDGTGSSIPTNNPTSQTKSVHISSDARVYLQDVQDHITALSNSTHNSIRSAENLTSLIFSTISTSQDASVRQLTLVSSFFLPLTLLCSYFGAQAHR